LHILITTDTLGGLWTYTRELVTGLVTRGIRVTLVSFGDIPMPEQTAWMDKLSGLEYRPTAFRLAWMEEGERDYAEASAFLASMVKELRPDLLHANHLYYGSLPVAVPRVVVAHDDLISWWKSVHGREPKDSRWLRWYREAMMRGVAEATSVVAPSQWMLANIVDCYGPPRFGQVIYNGRNPVFFNPYVCKENTVLAVGRMLDAGKQVHLLTEHAHPLPVCIVGSELPMIAPKIPLRADVKLAVDELRLAFRGRQTESQLRMLYSRASIYAATSRYEPSGMAALEAAFSRCAILANDIPSFREIWGDDAIYFRANDADSLAEVIHQLSAKQDLCRGYGNRAFQRARERYTANRMTDEYLQCYSALLGRKTRAA
jgi:glycosyltransferase involved in cell wall biosynthesis